MLVFYFFKMTVHGRQFKYLLTDSLNAGNFLIQDYIQLASDTQMFGHSIEEKRKSIIKLKEIMDSSKPRSKYKLQKICVSSKIGFECPKFFGIFVWSNVFTNIWQH